MSFRLEPFLDSIRNEDLGQGLDLRHPTFCSSGCYSGIWSSKVMIVSEPKI